MTSRHRPPRPQGRRRAPHGPRSPAERRPETLFLYGLHPAIAALSNPARRVNRVLATPNALARLKAAGVSLPAEPEETSPRDLDRLLGGDTVHQGVVLEVAPLDPVEIGALHDKRLVVCLDQVSDPHNVGAILRSAAAFGADAVLSTARHAPTETGVLAKSASGALDLIPLVTVGNLARALDDLGYDGFVRIGFDEAAESTIEAAFTGARIALVLGAEGKGLRRLTREKCDRIARLPTSGSLASLNVSNAAALGLYVARRHLDSLA
ncbi:MAG: RNA methyltransferase [Bauldia sp.]|uniref:TrmH family RNA methyltransferase n=1 Tax=Bauldia sp. TaxID=2575872 RepID=UPI001DAEADDD|nr:RNA methyltransferase [Bauldia sp.]MCB1497273.1 RNA methyltransferase [Bauldia sp.]